MIKSQNVISQMPKQEHCFYITASLLNSWQRIWDSEKYVKEGKDDIISLEEKRDNAMQKAKEEFLDVLNKIPIKDNEYMKRGREYESDVYAGRDEIFSPIVENGEFQADYTRKIKLNGMDIMLYGILDCLKAGRIYDIKRVGFYTSGKYKTSHQHPMYFALVPEALDFTYLICDDKGDHHLERYERQNCENIENVITQFLSWLEANELIEVFKIKWKWIKR